VSSPTSAYSGLSPRSVAGGLAGGLGPFADPTDDLAHLPTPQMLWRAGAEPQAAVGLPVVAAQSWLQLPQVLQLAQTSLQWLVLRAVQISSKAPLST